MSSPKGARQPPSAGMTTPRCTGTASPCATSRPPPSQIAAEKSILFFTFEVRAVRVTITSALSAVVTSAFLRSSRRIGSIVVMVFFSGLAAGQDDVIPAIESRLPVRQHDDRRVVFLDDDRPLN